MYLLIIIMESSKIFFLSLKIKMNTQKIFFSLHFTDSLVTCPQNGPPALDEVMSPSSSDSSSPAQSKHH